ncbi:hypothetical protein ILYODFUR_037673 [Ilyodon furcidens]|uniref:Uncharacterized protein n=1 Tax=Ilyodon furcidens TaxID=33524 RepID=A0ABV0T3H2_9TELE
MILFQVFCCRSSAVFWENHPADDPVSFCPTPSQFIILPPLCLAVGMSGLVFSNHDSLHTAKHLYSGSICPKVIVLEVMSFRRCHFVSREKKLHSLLHKPSWFRSSLFFCPELKHSTC